MENIKVKKFNKEYELIQNYEVKLNLFSNIQKRVLLLSDKDNLYLSIDNNIQKIAENYYLPISLKFLDLNNDNNIEIKRNKQYILKKYLDIFSKGIEKL